MAHATQRYLLRHAEPQSQAPWPFGQIAFEHVVIVPAYDESRSFLDAALTRRDDTSWLLIVVVNATIAADSGAIERTVALLDFQSTELPIACATSSGRAWRSKDARRALWLIDCATAAQRFAPDQGVGLARKIGLDVALANIAARNVRQPLMRCTDADARWPDNYFDHRVEPDISALTFGFKHVGSETLAPAQLVYDQRLRDYPRELTRAGSTYGFQALGSALAVNAEHYAQAGGCPKRQAGEDFHLLAKLSKLGRVVHRGETIIELQARTSHRVPFGTGPGVQSLAAEADATDVPFFTATQSFDLLAHILRELENTVQCSDSDAVENFRMRLEQRYEHHGPGGDFASVMDIDALCTALERARAASPNGAQRVAHIVTWFDALKTRQLLHRLRDAGWSDVSYRYLEREEPARLRRSQRQRQDEELAEALGFSSSSARSSS